MTVVELFKSSFMDDICKTNNWCDMFSPADYDAFIKSVNNLEFSENVLYAISFTIKNHTYDELDINKVATILVRNTVFRIVE